MSTFTRRSDWSGAIRYLALLWSCGASALGAQSANVSRTATASAISSAIPAAIPTAKATAADSLLNARGAAADSLATVRGAAALLRRPFNAWNLADSTDRPANTLPSIRARSGFLARRDTSWWLPLASFIVPGSGQLLLGQNRFVAYFAAEGYALFGYFNERAEMLRERDRSQGLARDVARALFEGTKPVGAWAYYEEMEKFVESGVYTRQPGTVLPEIDPETYNGWLWQQMRNTYWKNPNVEPDHLSSAYANSINEYNRRSIKPEFRWSWRNAQLEQDIYRRAIRNKNQANRDANLNLRLMLANSMLSMLDAFVTLRVSGRFGAVGEESYVTATLPWAPFGRPSPR